MSTDRKAVQAAMKASRSQHSKEQIAGLLVKAADSLFDGRVDLRKMGDILSDAYDDATGLVTHDMYGNALVKETRDQLQSLDHQIGDVARQMENLARELKKK